MHVRIWCFQNRVKKHYYYVGFLQLAKYYNLFICVQPHHNILYKEAIQPLAPPNNNVNSSVRPHHIPNISRQLVFPWSWHISLGLIHNPLPVDLRSPNLSQWSFVIKLLRWFTFRFCTQMRCTGTNWYHSWTSDSFCWLGKWDTQLELLRWRMELALFLWRYCYFYIIINRNHYYFVI